MNKRFQSTSMKKIVLVTPDFPPEHGGIQNVLYNLAKNLKIDVIAPRIKGDEEFDKTQSASGGFKIYRIPCVTENKKTAIPFMIVKTILMNPDTVICGHIITAIVGILTCKPYIVYTYGMEIFVTKHKALFGWMLKKAFKVITISEFTSNYLIKLGVSPEKIIKILPVVDTNIFNPGIAPVNIIKKYNLSNKSVMLTVGRMAKSERYKGHDTIIKILPEIIKKVPDVVWVVAGTGDDSQRIKDIVVNSKLSNYVIFTGKVPENELPALYKAANIFVMPSIERKDKTGIKGEGFGIVYIEANACGIPVVAYKTAGVTEAVINGETGILINSGDTEELTNTLIKLLIDKNLSKELGMNGYKRVVNELDTSSLRKKFSGILQ